jgi:hypothetical protein
MADQINAAIAENRPGLRDFTQNGLYEYTGLAQDAQRMVDQITRVSEGAGARPGPLPVRRPGPGRRAEIECLT